MGGVGEAEEDFTDGEGWSDHLGQNHSDADNRAHPSLPCKRTAFR